MRISSRPLLIVAISLAAVWASPVWSNVCDDAYEKAASGSFEDAVLLANECLARENVVPEERRKVLIGRAWAHYSLGHYDKAVDDQALAIAMQCSTQREYLNFSLFLHHVGRSKESLEAALKAKAFPGETTMPVQYRLGWAYYEAGRYSESVASYSEGVPAQPDFPFVYYRRALAYEKLDNVNAARSDLEKVAQLLSSARHRPAAGSLLKEIGEKLDQFSISHNW